MNRKLITFTDVCLIAVVIFICAIAMFHYIFSNNGNIAVVTVDEQVIAELELHSDYTERIETSDGYNTIVVKNGVCLVSEADCRDGICVNHQAINKVGQSIVCLPHKLIVEIK